MKHFIALDIGAKRTGIASCSSQTLVPVSLQTFAGSFSKFLATRFKELVTKTQYDIIVIGMPYLPDGTKGSQALFVDACIQDLQQKFPTLCVYTIDERYTSGTQHSLDPDAKAAITILQLYLDTLKNSN